MVGDEVAIARRQDADVARSHPAPGRIEGAVEEDLLTFTSFQRWDGLVGSPVW